MLRFYPGRVAIKIIKIYQKTISFDHGLFKFFYPRGFCRFHPTCSEYAIQVILKHGLLAGGLKSLWRVLRCNPFNSGGFDPPK